MPARVTGTTTPAEPPKHPAAEPNVLRIKPRANAADRVPFFYLTDPDTAEERQYTVLAHPGANIALEYLAVGADFGESSAVHYMLGKLLGDDGYAALRRCEDLTNEHLAWIIAELTKLTLGALEAPKD